MKRAYYILFILLFIAACKKNKEKTMVISGTIYDGVNGGGLAGASVLLSYQAYQSGVASTAFTSLGTVTTDGNGRYGFSFEKPSAIKYRIQVDKTSYFSISNEINPDNLSTSTENIYNYSVFPSASFKISIKNLNPFNAQDKIIYQNLSEANSCSGCCNNLISIYNGTTIDTSQTCSRYGDKYVRFQWIVTKNNINNTFTDSIFCPKGMLTSYQINY